MVVFDGDRKERGRDENFPLFWPVKGSMQVSARTETDHLGGRRKVQGPTKSICTSSQGLTSVVLIGRWPRRGKGPFTRWQMSHFLTNWYGIRRAFRRC